MENIYYPLNHYEFVRVHGVDAVAFLQGQLSCNTELLSAQQSLTGVLCNLKGRAIADFRVVKHQDDCILQCAQGMAETIVATLSKYAVFSKVEISSLNTGLDRSLTDAADISVIGLIDEISDTVLHRLNIKLATDDGGQHQTSDYSVIRLPGLSKRVEIWFHHPRARDEFMSKFALQASADLNRWQREDIAAGIIHVTPTMSEEFTPQLLNYDISGLIDFTKGCYTGQEIVARMFYRGTAKKRLYLASSSDTINAGSQIVVGSASQEGSKGIAILAYSNLQADVSLLLSVLAREVAESALPLRLSDRADSTVTIQNLPYSEK